MNDTPQPYTISSAIRADGILHLQLTPKTGSVFPFSPGQYVTLRFKEGQGASFERSFSITSSPLTHTHLEFGIRVLGAYTQQLATLKEGDAVWVRGPFGHFTFDPVRDTNLVLIAGGIGITPFLSMLRYIKDAGLRTRVALLFSNKKLAEIPYLGELQELESALPSLAVHYFVTDEPTNPKKYKNVSFQRLDRTWLAAHLDPNAQPAFYICGPSGFMDATRENLISLNVPESAIHQEDFSFAPPKIRKSDILFYLGGLSAASVITIVLLLTVYRVEAAKAATKQLTAPIVTTQSTPQSVPIVTQTPTPTPTPTPTRTPTATQTTPTQTAPTRTAPTQTTPTVTQTPTPVVQPRTTLS